MTTTTSPPAPNSPRPAPSHPRTGSRPQRIARARDWAHRRHSTRLALRVGVFLLGSTLVLAGLAMLVLPGPGWAAIIFGIVVLASEYAWAQRLLVPVRAVALRGLNAVHPMPHRRATLATLVVTTTLALSIALTLAWAAHR